MADTVAAIIALAQACITATIPDLCEVCGHSGTPMPPAAHCCDCGEGLSGRAYIQIERVYPVSTFPSAKNDSIKCHGTRLAVEFAVTIYRCVATVDDEGEHPSCEDTTAEMFRNIEDMELVRQALICCLREEAHPDAALQIVLADQRPVNPQGGCGGTITRVIASAGPEILRSAALLPEVP